jgi:hypothetical protein
MITFRTFLDVTLPTLQLSNLSLAVTGTGSLRGQLTIHIQLGVYGDDKGGSGLKY